LIPPWLRTGGERGPQGLSCAPTLLGRLLTRGLRHLIDSALDAALSREGVIGKIKEIRDVVESEEEDEDLDADDDLDESDEDED
jgi:hypothetical protein